MAGTITQAVTILRPSKGNEGSGELLGARLDFTCTADAADGSFPSTDVSAANTAMLKGMYFLYMHIKNGATATTDNSDIAWTDEFGVDLLGGAGANALDAVVNAQLNAKVNSLGGCPMVIGTLTLAITGNSVNSANPSIVCVFGKYPMGVNGLT